MHSWFLSLCCFNGIMRWNSDVARGGSSCLAQRTYAQRTKWEVLLEMRGATHHLYGKRCAHLIGCPSEQCLVLACRGRSWSACAQTVWLAAVLPESASARKKHTNTQTCRVLTWPGKTWRCYALPTLPLVAIEVSSNIRSDALRESKRTHKPCYVLKVLRPTITTTQHHQTEKGEARTSTWRSDYAKDGKKDACHTQTKPCALRKPIVRTPQSTSWHARSRVLFSQIRTLLSC
jgi:hypothetical protein